MAEKFESADDVFLELSLMVATIQNLPYPILDPDEPVDAMRNLTESQRVALKDQLELKFGYRPSDEEVIQPRHLVMPSLSSVNDLG